MESQFSLNLSEKQKFVKSNAPAVKWFKEWVPQDVVATGGKCSLLRWVSETQLNALQEKAKEPPPPDPEPEPTTEVLFLCSFEGCGKTFIDAGALRKHSHIHGERQYICHFEGCGKKFLDSSKLKRHHLTHTGERDFVCPHEGCGKAFSLDFNLRSHMKTHSQENYHICPFPDCGKRYAHDYKLKNHIASHHEKTSPVLEVVKHSTPPEKASKFWKASSVVCGPASSERPHVCPYEGCDKAYIHKYKLKLHLRREHPGHVSDENTDNTAASLRVEFVKNQKHAKPRADAKMPTAVKISMLKGLNHHPPAAWKASKRSTWQARDETYEDDSEETEEDQNNNGEDGWRYGEFEDDRDEETEDED